MWNHCIVCAGDLGSNDTLEVFPTGSTIAYDPQVGRLWVICPQCDRWNLTPLEERWEALESLERIWETVTARASTEHIALGKLPSGMTIVRVGNLAGEREFAFWRWGRHGHRGIPKGLVLGAAGLIGTIAGLTVISPVAAAVGIFMIAHGTWMSVLYRQGLLTTGMVNSWGGVSQLRRMDCLNAGMNPSDDELGWSIHIQRIAYRLKKGGGWRSGYQPETYWKEFTGDDAVAIARRAFPLLNQRHAKRTLITDAIQLISESGGPERYLKNAATQKPRWVKFRHYPPAMKLAMEMVLFQEEERRALEGELRRLEASWVEAEELAAISDSLLPPRGWRQFLARAQQAGDER
jgi:hypothetical protein